MLILVPRQIIWTGVFQYCVLRVLMTVVSVLAQVGGRYCEESMSPAFAHVWVCCDQYTILPLNGGLS